MDSTKLASDERTRVTSGPVIALDSAGVDAARRRVVEAMFGASALPPARTIGPYEVIDVLGRGAMGVVYLAQDDKLDRRIAVKVLGHRADESAERRLLEEAKTLAKVQHPNVVAVHDVGRDDQGVYLVMEYVAGTTLREWIRAEDRTPRRIAEIFVQIGRGLAAVHAAGFVHRDFKPSNVLVGRGDRPLVADFGLALSELRWVSVEGEPGTLDPLAATQANPIVAGTPAYMAPEQFLGLADERSDQFGFCVALFEALYGARPFPETTRDVPSEQWASHLRAPAGTRVPKWMHAILVRGLAFERADRWASMEGLVAALEDDPAARRRRRRSIVAVAASVIAAATAGAWAMHVAPSCDEATAELEAVWGPQPRERLRAAFMDESVVAGETTLAVLEAEIDRYAGALRSAELASCEATLVRREQTVETRERRDLCLDRRVHALAALVHVAQQQPAEIVRRPGSLLAGLPEVEMCADIERLTLGVAPPGDAETSALVDDVLARLAEAEANLWVERSDLAAATVEDVRASVDASSYPPLQAAHALAEGRVAARNMAFERARERLTHAFFTAHAHRDDEVAALAAIEMLYMVGYWEPRPVEAALWAEQAKAAAIREGRERRADLLTALAAWYRTEHRDEEVLALLKEVLESKTEADPLQRAIALGNVAIALSRLRRYEEAEPYLRETVDAMTALFGDAHPATLSQLTKLGSNLLGQRRLDDALPLLKRAAAGLSGTGHEDETSAWGELGRLHLAREEPEAALEALTRARDQALDRFGASSFQAASMHVNLGAACSASGRFDEAAREYARAAEIFTPKQGAPFLEASLAWTGVGQVRIEQAEVEVARAAELWALAIEAFTRAEAIVRTVQGDDSVALARPLASRADALRRAGRADEGLGLARRALEILEGHEAAAAERAEPRFVLARILVATGADREEALALARQARDGFVGTAQIEEAERWITAHATAP